MGMFVNGKWREDVADDYGKPAAPATVPAPSRTTSSVAAVPAPAAMPSYGNTNDQSVRADLRKQGYFVDASGVYAPGAGQRVGDTFSGAQASQNVAPSASRLPIINGTPVSPSNGLTGPQTGAIMYRSDPQYASLFGAGTPGYSSTSMQANALPSQPIAGQQSLADWNTQQAAVAAPLPAPTVQPSVPGTAPVTNAANVPAVTDPAAQAAAANPAADPAAFQAGLAELNESGTGYGPYATAEPPTLTSQGQYAENGKLVQKSVDQFGNPYFQTVGNAPTAVAPPAGTPAAAASPPGPAAVGTPVTAHTDPAAVTNPASVTPTGLQQHTFIGTDGKPQVVSLSEDDYQMALQDQQNAQAAVRQATQFSQGIEQGKLDVSRITQEYSKAYNDALVANNSATLAQTAARDAMNNEIQKQAQEINRAAQVATAQFQTGQLEQQRSATAQQNAVEMQKLEAQRQATAMSNSTEHDKLSLQRQQGRGRRLPTVRYA